MNRKLQSSQIIFSVVLLLLFIAVGHQFLLRSSSIMGGAWDDGNIWFIILKSSSGLRPNLDFVSGYPGGFEWLVSLISPFVVWDFEFLKVVNVLIFILYFSAAFFGLRTFVSGQLNFGYSLLIAYAGYGAWTSFAPGVFVQLISIFSIGIIFSGAKRSSKTLFLLGILSGLSVLFKQSGVFLIAAIIGLLCLDFYRLKPRLSPAAKFLVVSPINVPFIGYFWFRFSQDAASITNDMVLFPWVLMALLLNSQIFSSGCKAQPLPLKKILHLLIRRYAPYSIGLLLTFSFFPIYYSREAIRILNDIFIRMPTLIDRHQENLSFFQQSSEVFFTFGALVLCTAQGNKVEGLERKLLYFLIFTVLVGFLGLHILTEEFVTLSFYWIFRPTLIWGCFIFCTFFYLKLITQNLNSWVERDIENQVSFQVMLVISIILATVWPYPSPQYVSGILLFLLICLVSHYFQEKKINRKFQTQFAAAFFLLFAAGIAKNNLVFLSQTSERLVLHNGIFRTAHVPHDRQKYFLSLSDDIKSILPASAKVAGYPNLNFTLIAAGFIPVTFQGNYFGDGDGDLKRFVADLSLSKVDCLVVNKFNWPYPKNFPYFPDTEKLIEHLGNSFILKKSFKIIDIYCVDDYQSFHF